MFKIREIAKTALKFFLVWLFFLIILFAYQVHLGFGDFTLEAFNDFTRAPWEEEGPVSMQYGLPVNRLISDALGSSLALLLPATLLSLALLLVPQTKAPPVLRGLARVVACMPLFWIGLLMAAAASNFATDIQHYPLMPVFITFCYLSCLGLSLKHRATLKKEPISQVIFLAGAYMVFEAALNWPGIGPLFFNSIIVEDAVLSGTIITTLLTIILIINFILAASRIIINPGMEGGQKK